jgi:hypothetical protein
MDGRWWVDYVLPYSGRLCQDFASWNEAFAEALSVEAYRVWL